MSIDPARVEQIYLASLAEELDPEDPSYREIEGIVHTSAFDLRKLETHREEVAKMLWWLPLPFQAQEQGGGGGWSFLNLCTDRDDRLWTGMHWTMEQLVQLGIGLGMAQWLGPRRMWDAFPGGMPYVSISVPDSAAGWP